MSPRPEHLVPRRLRVGPRRALVTAVAVALVVAVTVGNRWAPPTSELGYSPAAITRYPPTTPPPPPTTTTTTSTTTPPPPTTTVAPAPAPAVAPAAPAATQPAAPPPPAPATSASSTLANKLNALLFNTDSCLEVHNAAGQLIYDHAGSNALAPASTQKLLVAAAALKILGPTYRFVTKVEATRQPVNGEVDNLWLVGGGDPVLDSPQYTSYLMQAPMAGGLPAVTTQLNILSNELAAAGVKSVPDGIHGDDSRYDDTRSLPTWKPVYLSEGDVAPLGALEVNDGLQTWDPAADTSDPSAYAASVLAELAGTVGITTSQTADGTAPAGAVVLASVSSPPLADIVTEMLRNSDNTAAEMLVREIDRAVGGPGTTADGVQVVMRTIASLGLPTAGLDLVDGSGLSPEDRVTCDTLAGALGLGTQPTFAVMSRLSVAGEYGTLVNRFLGTPAVGHLAGKTGNIGGVIGLVGRLTVGPPVTFSFLLNGPFNYATGASYEDQLVADLVSYSS